MMDAGLWVLIAVAFLAGMAVGARGLRRVDRLMRRRELLDAIGWSLAFIAVIFMAALVDIRA